MYDNLPQNSWFPPQILTRARNVWSLSAALILLSESSDASGNCILIPIVTLAPTFLTLSFMKTSPLRTRNFIIVKGTASLGAMS